MTQTKQPPEFPGRFRSTDLAILRAFAAQLEHPAVSVLERPFVHYVANQPRKAQDHFYGLREAKPDLVGIAIYDRLDQQLPGDPNLRHYMWRRRELENYLCQRETLLRYAEEEGRKQAGDLFGIAWRNEMNKSINEIEAALATLGEPSPWGVDIKASEGVLDRVFKRFYEHLSLPNLMSKSDYFLLAPFVSAGSVDIEIREKLDAIYSTAGQARRRVE